MSPVKTFSATTGLLSTAIEPYFGIRIFFHFASTIIINASVFIIPEQESNNG